MVATRPGQRVTREELWGTTVLRCQVAPLPAGCITVLTLAPARSEVVTFPFFFFLFHLAV